MTLWLTKRRYVDWEHLLSSYKSFISSKLAPIVLEIGASTKERTAELAKYCHRLIGVEYFLERKPKDFANVRYLVGDWQKLSKLIQPGSIDIAVSSHVIEHVPDDLKSLNELYIVLKPNGVAIINTPNRKRLVRAFIDIFKERRFPYWEHVREYTEDDLQVLLNECAFDNFNVIPVGFGIHGGPLFCYSEYVPKRLRKFACFYEVHLFKKK